MSIYVFLTRIELLTHSIHAQSNENQLNIFSKNYSCRYFRGGTQAYYPSLNRSRLLRKLPYLIRFARFQRVISKSA
jgi:hypothetical protein